MFINEKKEITVTPRNKKWYVDKGYTVNKIDEKIEINTVDMSHYSKEKIKFECDYCHKIKEEESFKYFKHKGKDCCGNCANLKTAEILKERTGSTWYVQTDEFKEKSKNTNIKKYGKEYYSQTVEAKERNKETCLNKYGYNSPCEVPEIQEKMKKTIRRLYSCDNIFQNEHIKNRIKENNIKKYGVDHHMKNPEIKEKVLKKIYESKKYINKINFSKNQKYICDLFNGELNYMFVPYCVDMFFPEKNIYLEYDGTGHDMCVKKHGMSEEAFKKREIIRYKFLKEKGLKEIRIVSLTSNKLPTDDLLLKIKRYSFDFLKNTNQNWIIFNLDEGIIKTKKENFSLDIIR